MKSEGLGSSQETLVPVHRFPFQHSVTESLSLGAWALCLRGGDCGHSLQEFLFVPLRMAYETFPKLRQRMMTNLGLLNREISRRSQQKLKIMSLTVWGTEYRSIQNKQMEQEKSFPRVLVAIMPSPQICVNKIPGLAIFTPRKYAKHYRNPHVWQNEFQNNIFQPSY